MKRYLVLFGTLLVTLHLSGQPWLKYYTPPKSSREIDVYHAKLNAFKEYWKDKEPGHGSGYKPFMRWAWMVGQRIEGDSTIGSDQLWKAYLAKTSNQQKAGIAGDWHYLGPDTPPTDLNSGQVIGAGRIDCIAFHPTDTNTIYIGSPTGGLWKTSDNGNSWVPLTDNLPGLGIADIAIHPKHPDTLYIATGDRDAGEIYAAGLLESYDGGGSWHSTSLSFDQSDQYVVTRVLINPMHPDTLIAATNKGIYFLTMKGGTKQKVLDGHFKDLAFRPGRPDTVYAASYVYGGASVYRSTDGGKTFSETSNGMTTTNIRRIELAVTPNRPDMVVALCSDKETSGLHAIYRSFNAGDSWTTLLSGGTKNLLATEPDGSGTGGQGWYDLSMAISPDNYAEIFVGGINIWRTRNGGGSWLLSSFGYPEWGISSAPYVHVDQHILKIDTLSGTLYSGNDGGIYRSYDKGITWHDISHNLGVLQIYRIGSSPQKRSLTLMGSQDNSSIMTTDTNWYVVIGGDGMEGIVDYTDVNTLYASSQYGNIGRSDDGGMNFRSIRPTDAGNGAWVTPYVIHPTQHKTLIAGYSEIYESFDQGESWKTITSGLSLGKNFTHLSISSFDPDVLYAATASNCWRSDNNGLSWINIHGGLPVGTIKYFAIHPNDPHTVWVALSNYNSGQKVYFSNDGGATWTNYSEGLPNIPVNCLVYQDQSNDILYAGTDLGIYYRSRNMPQWENFGNGLPNVIVNELEIFYPDSLLRAATYGRGLWESPLMKTDTTKPYADFTVDKQTSCIGSPFRFINKGSENADSLRWAFGTNGNPATVLNQDTVPVLYDVTGDQDITLIVYKNGLSDSLTRENYVKSVDQIDLTILSDFDTYFWKGDTARLEAKGADTYTWSPSSMLNTDSGSVVYASPDSTTTIYVTGVQGTCTRQDSLHIEVYPNDMIRYATPLTFGSNGPFINNRASVEANEPSPPAGDCNTQLSWCDEFNTGEDLLGHTVWFTFTAPPSGVISIDSHGFDEQIAVYSATNADSILSGTYDLLAANDDYHDETLNFAAAITDIQNLTEGKTYWVQVDGSAGNTVGTFYLDLYDSPLEAKTIEFPNITNDILLYPNPATTHFTLHFNTGFAGDGQVRIYSTTGKLMFERTISGVISGSETVIRSESLKPGLYILTVTTEKGVWNAIIMLQ